MTALEDESIRIDPRDPRLMLLPLARIHPRNPWQSNSNARKLRPQIDEEPFLLAFPRVRHGVQNERAGQQTFA